jgi:pantetheine-phosphate adenylyltransferase
MLGQQMKAIYPGTFDPFTKGHLNIIERASKIFSEITIAVAISTSKKTMFSLEQRIDYAEKCVKHLPNVKVKPFSGMFINFVQQEQCYVVIRGIRDSKDAEYEIALQAMQKSLCSQIEFLMLPAIPEYSFISSTFVRDIIINKGDYNKFIPLSLENYINN